MLIELYALMFAAAVGFTMVSWLQNPLWDTKNVLFPFFAAFMFLSLALASGRVQYDHCSTPVDYKVNETVNKTKYYYSTGSVNGSIRYDSPFTCTTVEVEQVGMIYFNGSLGLLMFIYAIIMTLDVHLNAQYLTGAGQEEKSKQSNQQGQYP